MQTVALQILEAAQTAGVGGTYGTIPTDIKEQTALAIGDRVGTVQAQDEAKKTLLVSFTYDLYVLVRAGEKNSQERRQELFDAVLDELFKSGLGVPQNSRVIYTQRIISGKDFLTVEFKVQ